MLQLRIVILSIYIHCLTYSPFCFGKDCCLVVVVLDVLAQILYNDLLDAFSDWTFNFSERAFARVFLKAVDAIVGIATWKEKLRSTS